MKLINKKIKKTFLKHTDYFNKLDGSSETRFEYVIDNKHTYNSYIIGIILGNGNFLSNSRIKINKGKVNNLDFKKELIKKYSNKPIINEKNNLIYSLIYKSIKFQYIYKDMYERLSQEIINRINQYSLGILYLDKGLLLNEEITINNLKYSKHDNERICAHIKNKYKITMVYKNNSFKLDKLNSAKFLDLIKETIILHSNFKTNGV